MGRLPQPLNVSMTTVSMDTEFYDVSNETMCPEGFNLTRNGTLCARASGDYVPADPSVLLYIIGVLTFYGCSLLFLLLKFVRSEQEDIALERYHEIYIDRQELRDEMSRGFVRGGRAGGPAGVSGVSRGLLRGGRAGGPAGVPGMSRGLLRGGRADGPAGVTGESRGFVRGGRAGGPAGVPGMPRGFVRGGRAGGPAGVTGMCRGLVRGGRAGRPAGVTGMDHGLVLGGRTGRPPGVTDLGRGSIRGGSAFKSAQVHGMDQDFIREENGNGKHCKEKS